VLIRPQFLFLQVETYPWNVNEVNNLVLDNGQFDNVMSQTLTLPLMGLDETFPEDLFVLHHPASNRYGCFQYEGIHGLACFSTEAGALRFAEWIELSGMKTNEVSFDEAREVAKDRPLPVVSLMLLDTINSPKIHFVR